MKGVRQFERYVVLALRGFREKAKLIRVSQAG